MEILYEDRYMIYEDRYMIVRKNTSEEIFIENKTRGEVIRVSLCGDHSVVTAAGCVMQPWAVNGLHAFTVRKI